MTILNLTQHAVTAEQAAAGVVEPADKASVQALLTFEELPDRTEVILRAAELAALAVDAGFRTAMIGGAPFLMPPLEAALKAAGIRPRYAFSVRESVETTAPDGSVRKTNVFRHAGWVEM